MSDGPYYVYILTNKVCGTLYVGVTHDLARRMEEHKTGAVPGFTREHDLKTLVYAEPHARHEDALAREKRLKKWNRAWKIQLIEKDNPHWHDLYDTILT